MEKIKITDDKLEQINIGKALFNNNPKSYSTERVSSMYRTIEDLAGAELLSHYTKDELFFMSIYDFWVYGNTISEEFYFHFPKKSHEEKSEYTTFRTRLKYMYKINKKEDSYIFNNKWETYKKFKDFYHRDIILIQDAEDYAHFEEFVKKHPVFVIKPTCSHIGIGVRKINVQDYSDAVSLFESLLEEGKKYQSDNFNNETSLLCEELIDQVEELAKIHPYSVNGIRITTFKDKGGDIKILYPWFKVGANKSFVTSAAFGTYDAGINPETGVVYTHGFKENGEYDEVHPLTNIKFKDYVIPKWSECIELVTNLAKGLSTINYVGWDMVLTPKGWAIMEGNFTGDFMWQMFNQKGFKKEWESLIGFKAENEFWWE